MKRTSKIVIVVSAIVLGAVGVYLLSIIGLGLLMNVELEDLRPKLLCETDHQALLAACRELSSQVADGKLEANYYRVRFCPHSEASRFPEAIRALRPRFVTITDTGIVRVEMNTKWWSFGVFAYPQGFQERFPDWHFGDRKLLDGLWYYDDGYLSDPNAYDKRIDAILIRCGKMKVPNETGASAASRSTN
jgi:hypothetical protein